MDEFNAVLQSPEYTTMLRWLDGEPVWPYAKIVEAWPHFEDWQARMFRDMAAVREGGEFKIPEIDLDAMTRRTMLRHLWIGAFGFAIPCAELLDELARHGPIVEIGAGTGYMTRLMRHRGIDVIGSDPALGGHGFIVGKYDPEQQSLGAKIMVQQYPERTVFCSWPTLKATWFRQALQAMRVGQSIVMIREDACAEETAWQYLDDCFEAAAIIDIPMFEHMNDYASVHVKRRNRARSK